MSKEIEALLGAINEAVESKVFSIEVLQNIATLRTKVATQEETIEGLVKANETYAKECRTATTRVQELVANEASVKTREAAVAKAEIQMAVDKKELELTRQSKTDFYNLALAAVKNPTFKQITSEYGNTSVSNGCGGYQTVPTNNMKTTVVEQE